MLHEKEEKSRSISVWQGEILSDEEMKKSFQLIINFLLPRFLSSLVKWKIQICHAYNQSYNLQSASNLFSISFLLNLHFSITIITLMNGMKIEIHGWSWKGNDCEIENLFYLARGHWKLTKTTSSHVTLVTFFCNRSSSWSFNGI